MKTKTILAVLVAFMGFSTANAQVKVGDNPTTIQGSAVLEIESTTKGFLPPRMTIAQRDAITSPAEGLTIYNTENQCLETYSGAGWISICSGIPLTIVSDCGSSSSQTAVVPVVSAGVTWMDRNLGASQAAASSTDANAYGDLYQWGRFADGHQCRTSSTTSTQATTAVPNAGNSWDGQFVINHADWLTPQNDALWQGVSGTNNPCPAGYRLPTDTEWIAEQGSWGGNQNTSGAFGSPLKLTKAGARNNGGIFADGTGAGYWSSTVDGANIKRLGFNDNSTVIQSDPRSEGLSVRCIKD